MCTCKCIKLETDKSQRNSDTLMMIEWQIYLKLNKSYIYIYLTLGESMICVIMPASKKNLIDVVISGITGIFSY